MLSAGWIEEIIAEFIQKGYFGSTVSALTLMALV